MFYWLFLTSVQCPCVLLCPGPLPLPAEAASSETPKEQTKVSLRRFENCRWEKAGWGLSELQNGCEASKRWLFPNTSKFAWLYSVVLDGLFLSSPEMCPPAEDTWLQQKEIWNCICLRSVAPVRCCELVCRERDQAFSLYTSRVLQVCDFS